MQNKIYERLAAEAAPKKHVLKNVALAFLCGGIIALVMQGFFDLFTKVGNVSKEDVLLYNAIIAIESTMILTMAGVYKKMAQIFGAGLFIPITGFANSVISEGIEYHTEGLIFGIGSRLMSLAGSVIAYGTLGATIYGLIAFILYSCGVNI